MEGVEIMVSEDLIREAVENYADDLYRVCLVMLKNTADAEDAVQDSFITYMQKAPRFNSSEHEKAWLIRVACNKCHDMIRYRDRHSTVSDELLDSYFVEESDSAVIDALMEVPEKYRIVLSLHYIEGYKVDEIAEMIGRSPSAVKMRLSKGRKKLEEKYRKGYM